MLWVLVRPTNFLLSSVSLHPTVGLSEPRHHHTLSCNTNQLRTLKTYPPKASFLYFIPCSKINSGFTGKSIKSKLLGFTPKTFPCLASSFFSRLMSLHSQRKWLESIQVNSQCWWECKLIQPLCKNNVVRFNKNENTYTKWPSSFTCVCVC